MTPHVPPRHPAESRSDYLVFTAVFILVSLPWLLGQRMLPWDAAEQFYPLSRYIADSLRAGEMPWWNPYQYSGTPVLADPQSLLFTLFTPIGALLGTAYTGTAFSALTLLHLLLGGWALIAYARHYDNTPLQRVLAALVYSLAAVATSRLQHVPQIVTYAYLPILVWLAHRYLQQRRLRDGAALAVLCALTFVNPNQVTLLGGLAVTAVTCWHWLAAPQRLRGGLGLLLAALAGALLAAPVLAAVLEFAGLSMRSALTLADSDSGSLRPLALLAAVFPGLFGAGGVARLSWGPNDITENWLYLGAATVFLLAQGLSRLRPASGLRLLGLLLPLLLCGWFALGLHGALYPWLFEQVPGFNLFRRPSDAIYPALLLVALLLVHLPAPQPGVGRALLVNLGTVALIVLLVYLSDAAAYAAHKQHADALRDNALVALGRYAAIALLLAFVHWGWPQHWQRHPAVYAPLVLLFALELVTPVRFREFEGGPLPDVQDASLQAGLAALRADGPGARLETHHGILGNGNLNLLRVPSTQGYNPMRLGTYHQIIGSGAPNSPRWFTERAPHYQHPWFQAIGLRHVLLQRDLLQPDAPENDVTRSARNQRQQLVAFASLQPEPLLDYEHWVLTKPWPPLWLSSSDPTQPALDPPAPEPALGQCELLNAQPSRLDVRCQLTAPATLIFATPHYPGWYACVGTQPAPLHAASGLLRAVRLPDAGAHTLTLRFEPLPWWRPARCG